MEWELESAQNLHTRGLWRDREMERGKENQRNRGQVAGWLVARLGHKVTSGGWDERPPPHFHSRSGLQRKDAPICLQTHILVQDPGYLVWTIVAFSFLLWLSQNCLHTLTDVICCSAHLNFQNMTMYSAEVHTETAEWNCLHQFDK